jgi:hypothetical protein
MTRPYNLTSLFASLLFLSLSLLLAAQSGGAQTSQPGMSPGGVATTPLQIAVTGCLKQSHETHSYFIADQNGTTWKLTSSAVNLAEHVNHSVMVTGKPIATDQQQGSSDQAGKTDDGAKPQPSLRVLTLKLLSPSCTR